MKQTDFMWKCKTAGMNVTQSDNAVVRVDLNEDVYVEHISAGTNSAISLYIKPDLEYAVSDTMFEGVIAAYQNGGNTVEAYKQLMSTEK